MSLIQGEMLREALLWERLPGGGVRCHVCLRRCRIHEGKQGYCLVRVNQGGRLYVSNFGRVSSLSVNPIEKKPVFHFYPGSRWLSLGSWSCNFRCPGCQNWELSHAKGAEGGYYLSPQEMVRLAQERGCLGLSWTFNEPTLWLEYTLEGAKLAKEGGLFTNYVTNGYITEEALDAIGPYLDVFRVDLKGFSADSYRRIAHIFDFSGILEATKRAKERWGMHVEVVTNVIPGYNDAELQGIASWVRQELGEDIPWHVTRFFPHLKLAHIGPTPLSLLERGWEIGRGEGLHYVYLGNVPGHPGENTHCHRCGRVVIERKVFDVTFFGLEKGRCPYCKAVIPGKFD